MNNIVKSPLLPSIVTMHRIAYMVHTVAVYNVKQRMKHTYYIHNIHAYACHIMLKHGCMWCLLGGMAAIVAIDSCMYSNNSQQGATNNNG